MNPRIRYLTLSLLLALPGLALHATPAGAQMAGPQPAGDVAYEIDIVAEGLAFPWSIAWLPGGEALVTQRGGELLRLGADGGTTAISGVPAPYVASQGGLFDVLPAPDFASSGMLYLSFAWGTPEANATRIVRGRLEGDALVDVEVIFTVEPVKDTPVHYGGRMAWMNDGTLIMTTGDGFDYREQAQRLDNLLGKTIRIDADGGIPADNPFVGRADALDAIWTLGHRSPQGLAVERATGRVYQTEHGPRGGDELNHLQAGHNYGWPVISWGIDYNGARISPFTEMEGLDQPLVYWTPSIAASGLTIYEGDAFPAWRGDAFAGGLVEQAVRRIDLEDGAAAGQEILFTEIGQRIRDVRTGPDGFLYILTDSPEGRVLRVRPPG